jgi:hypothetical protein
MLEPGLVIFSVYNAYSCWVRPMLAARHAGQHRVFETATAGRRALML